MEHFCNQSLKNKLGKLAPQQNQNILNLFCDNNLGCLVSVEKRNYKKLSSINSKASVITRPQSQCLDQKDRLRKCLEITKIEQVDQSYRVLYNKIQQTAQRNRRYQQTYQSLELKSAKRPARFYIDRRKSVVYTRGQHNINSCSQTINYESNKEKLLRSISLLSQNDEIEEDPLYQRVKLLPYFQQKY